MPVLNPDLFWGRAVQFVRQHDNQTVGWVTCPWLGFYLIDVRLGEVQGWKRENALHGLFGPAWREGRNVHVQIAITQLGRDLARSPEFVRQRR